MQPEPKPTDMPTPKLLAYIAALQLVQKCNHPSTTEWKRASELLQPCFAEMARREPFKG